MTATASRPSMDDTLGNATAGVIIAILNITMAISIAALMFAGLPPAYFITGVTILLLSTALCGLGGTFGSGFEASIVSPRSELAPVYAGMIASVAAAMGRDASDPAMLPTMLATIVAATMASGAALYALGRFRIGALVRYIPYPVMGGFFAGIGLIFLLGGLAVASGTAVTADTLLEHLHRDLLRLTAPALAFGIVLHVAHRRVDHWAVVPGLLALAVAGFYGGLAWAGLDHAAAAAEGWLPSLGEAAIRLPVIAPADLLEVDWGVVADQSASIATLAMLSAIILLLDTSGIEIIADRDLDPDRELKAAGLINLANGALAGFVSVQAASDTALVVKLGGRRRLMVYVYVGVVLVSMAVGTDLVAGAPTFVLGGLLVYLGLDFLVDWAWATRRDLPTADHLIILAILAAIAVFGLLEGVAFGFLIAVVLFVVSYSRLGVLKSELGGDAHGSHVVRRPDLRRVLDDEGRRIWIMKLQGFIFFGTADALLRAARRRIEQAKRGADGAPPLEFLVLDFRDVSQLDTSAVQTFVKLRKLTRREGVSVVCTDLGEQARARLEAIDFFDEAPADPHAARRLAMPHLDEGVAWCETAILARRNLALDEPAGSLEARLAGLLGDEAAAHEIAPFFEEVRAEPGEYLFRQGEPGDGLYVLHSGSASVVMATGRSRERVIRIFEEGTVLGEMALYTGAPRSAAIRIEQPSLLYRLEMRRFARMQREVPQSAGLFHAFVVRLLAERLERANRALQSVS